MSATAPPSTGAHPRGALPGRRRIVAAVGASGGTHALRTAAMVAQRTGDRLAVVSVVEPPGVLGLEDPYLELNPWHLEQEREERRASLERRLEHLRQLGGPLLSPPIEVFVGHAAVVIADVSRELGARLVVMGIGPHSLRHRIFSAETALATSRRSSCPILAVHERSRGLPRSAVVAVDFSPESIHAARKAVCLMADGGHVHLVHVKSMETAAVDVDGPSVLSERFLRLRSALDCARPVHITSAVREGHPAEQILQAARAQEADLVVAGMRGLNAFERLLAGSVSSALLRGAECSVLLAPGPDAVERGELIRVMRGTSRDDSAGNWAAELERFARRNERRRAALEIDDHAFGAQRQASGYSLLGATYDEHDGRVALMFGSGNGAPAHFTHTIGRVRSVSISEYPPGTDDALCVESDDGRAILTFLDR